MLKVMLEKALKPDDVGQKAQGDPKYMISARYGFNPTTFNGLKQHTLLSARNKHKDNVHRARE